MVFSNNTKKVDSETTTDTKKSVKHSDSETTTDTKKSVKHSGPQVSQSLSL